jgi:hypothetical protein
MSSLTCYRKYPIVWHYRTVKLSQWAKARTDLHRGMADVEGRPIAGSCRAASHRHHHRQGNQGPRLMRSNSTPEFLRRSQEKICKHNEAASWFTHTTTA